jgi:hypothetical protein
MGRFTPNAPSVAGITDPLTIIDPLNPSQNVGRNCFRFFQVQATFRAAHAAILAAAAASPPSQERLEALAASINSANAAAARARGDVAGVSARFSPFGTRPGVPTAADPESLDEFPLLGHIISCVRGL